MHIFASNRRRSVRTLPAWGALLLAMGIALGGPASATVSTHTFTFAEPTWSAAPPIHPGMEIPSIAGSRTIGHPGEPLLPVYSARILLPPGERLVEVRVVAASAPHLSRHLAAPADYEHPLSAEGPFAPARAKASIYNSTALYPATPARVATEQLFRGHAIAYVNLFPLRVRPAAEQAAFTGSMTLEVTTVADAARAEASARTYREDLGTDTWLARQVVNPEVRDAYAAWWRAAGTARFTPPAARTLVDPADTFLHVIITDASLVAAYQPLADDRTAKGLPATIVLADDIDAAYPGVDRQERIRNFILDAYQNWETEYVFFGGDIDDIPDRDCYCYVIDEGTPMETNDLCCELYYAGLDGTWNDDGDDRWGEVEEADLVAEVHVGRCCADTPAEATAFVEKLLRYERQPVASEIESAAFFGEYLWEDTYGGWYMDEIRLGADTWGYTTAGVPLDWTTVTHYEVDGDDWSGSTYINEMNAGTHMFHHLGHSNSGYNAKVYTSDVPSFTADGVTHTHHFGYSQGCMAGEFDNADCILEEFIHSPTGYAAFIGNTRYGFGVHYTTNGSSQYYHRQYADALFAEGINELAAANDDSRADNVGYIEYESNRWVHYEVTAFGDPAMPVWTDTPRTPELVHAGAYVLGTGSYGVTVNAEGGPVAGARVALWDEAASAYAFGVTDAAGQVTLALDPAQPGTLHLVVSDANLLVTEETLPIVASGPYLIVATREISDAGGGNGDGACDAGETIALTIELTNVWTGPIAGVTATLASENPHVAIDHATVAYGDFTGGETRAGLGGDHFLFTISGGCPDQEELAFELTIQDDGDNIWEAAFAYRVDAPLLAVAHCALDDALGGDGDGCLEPGESARLTLDLGNAGHTGASAVSGTLIAGSGWLTVTQADATAGEIPVGSQATLAPAFEVTLAAAAPNPSILPATLQLTGAWSLAVDLPLEIAVGGFQDDMEGGDGAWTHAVVTGGFTDQWHRSSQRNHTPGGSYAWKFGDTGSGEYADLADGALVTPPIDVLSNVTLTFWHWIDAEESSAYPGRCYDGGLIEVSWDGGVWAAVTPEGGYSHTIREGGTPGPFPDGTPVFSGTHDWEAVTCLLEAQGGSVQFRFRFGSDGAATGEGWYLDDLRVASWDPASGIAPSETGERGVQLAANHPNPFGPVTTIRFALPERAAVRLLVLDPQGRVVRTLAAGSRAGGTHSIAWDGRDTRGDRVGTGIYFCCLEVDGVVLTRKMTLLR